MKELSVLIRGYFWVWNGSTPCHPVNKHTRTSKYPYGVRTMYVYGGGRRRGDVPSELGFQLAPFQLLTGFRDAYRGKMHADVMLNLSTRKTAAQQNRLSDYRLCMKKNPSLNYLECTPSKIFSADPRCTIKLKPCKKKEDKLPFRNHAIY